ncbi:MAG: hypothetical protein LBI68_03710 [Azoarcus sp.]|nr:hypothetical protein [Azoarcus sp.]
MWLVKVLIALDFPAFDRPAKAISQLSAGGNADTLAMEVSKQAWRNMDMGSEGRAKHPGKITKKGS